MKVGIGADHRGFALKAQISAFLHQTGHAVTDYGSYSDDAVDYPHIALQCAEDVRDGRIDFGILSCYTGQGMAMTANKVRGIRAAVCTTPETAALTRAHNNANILVIPGTLTWDAHTQRIVTTFLHTPFEGGRHLRRVNIIEEYENKHPSSL
jgi:ribose 5-phosphate isomerase B